MNEIKPNVQLETKGEMFKNTYLVFISKEQLKKISNISLVKPVEQEEKVSYIGGSIESANFLLVITPDDIKFQALRN